jgi:hypothetical protein
MTKGSCGATGVNQGLAALNAGGTPPRFLIIDDGWQCTDVDPGLRPALTPADIPRLEAELQVHPCCAAGSPHTCRGRRRVARQTHWQGVSPVF